MTRLVPISCSLLLASVALVADTVATPDTVVVFNEIHYQPVGDTEENEWIELHNQMGIMTDVSRWRLGDGIDFTIPAKTIIPPGGYLVIAKTPKEGQLGPFTGSLNNSGERLRLFNQSDRLMDDMTYGDGGRWPVAPDGSGVTLAKRDKNAASGPPENWTSSSQVGGTPGTTNFPDPDDVVLTTERVFEESGTWRVNESASDLGAAWASASHPVGGDWKEGSGPLGFEPRLTDTLGTTLTFPSLNDPYVITYYLESQFEVTADIAGRLDHLLISHLVDDGAVFYINGEEVLRFNLPAGDIDASTLAPKGEAEWIEGVRVPSGAIVPGTNRISIEVHQEKVGSSDIVFGMRLDRVTRPPAIEATASNLRLNEIASVAGDKFWVELKNDGQTAENAGRLTVSVSGDPAREVVIPEGTVVDPSSYLLISAEHFSFNVDDSDRIFLYSPGRNSIVDARAIGNRLRGRDETLGSEWGDEWLFPNAPSPGEANTFALDDAIVINEIFYHGPSIVSKLGTPPTIESQITKGFDANWRYEASGADQGAGWAATAHSNWPSGAGMLGFDNKVFPEAVNTEFERPFALTNYFEAEIDLAAAEFDAVDSLEIFHYIDDGAVFYVNGTEVGRFNMPDGPVDATTRASSGGDAELEGPVKIPKSMLVPGQNRISVEVHQSSPGSSDVIFGAEIRVNVITSSGIEAVPYSESDEEWIELHNRSAQPVDLSDWSFADGVSYTFPKATTIAVGGYLVIARDAALVREMRPGVTVFGEYAGRLSKAEDRLELVDAKDNPVDRVHYFDGGRWPSAADGGGSSLELRDPDADNAIAEAWSPSDETSKTAWRTYKYSGEASRSTVGPDNQWREFVMGMLTAGEILIDDISLIEQPRGVDAEQLISNGGFDSGLDDWRLRGNHSHGEIIDDPDQPGNKVLRIVATGPTEHMSNHIETNLPKRVSNKEEYEISFRAKWITGGNQLHTRLYFSRLPRVNAIDRPVTGGTPGAPNSTAGPNIGPTFTGFLHSPAVPEAGEPATVRVIGADPDEIESMTLFYSVNDDPFETSTMASSGDGSFEASVPGQDAEAVVHFYVSGTDTLGATSLYPRLGPESRAAYKVNDGNAAPTDLQNFRIVVTNADRDWLHTDINVMSNDRIPATVIYREDEIYYDVRVRLKGSERARSQSPRVGFNVRFNADQKFRGIHETASIDRSEGVGTGQLEALFDMMMANSTGKFARYYDLIQIISPQDRHVGGAVLQIGRYEDVWAEQFENGVAGTRYEYELIYYPTSADRDDNKRPQPDGVVRTTVRNLGDDNEDYRWNFLKKDHREADDFSSIIAYCKHFSKRGAEFEEGLEDVVDVDNWLRGMAYAVLSGAGDNAGAGSQHNGMYYARPDGRVMFLAHDMDFAFDANRSITANPECAKIVRVDKFARIYYGHLQDIVTKTYNRNYMEQWTSHFDDLLPRQRWSSHLSYINSRSSNVLRQVDQRADDVEFGIAGDGNYTTEGSVVDIEGTGWVNVRKIRLAGTGEELAVEWTDVTDWLIKLPADPGTSIHVLEALDFQNNLIGSTEISVTNSGTTAPTVPADAHNIAISELHYHPSEAMEEVEFLELANTSSRNLNVGGATFTAGIGFTFDTEEILTPGGRLILARNPAALRTKHPNIPESVSVNAYTSSLSNGGERLAMASSTGVVIIDFSYNDKAPWPIDADGGGYSLVLVDPQASPGIVLNWRPSATPGGTPGIDDSVGLDDWLPANGLANAEGNTDGDGAPDLVEYTTGTSPLLPNGVLFFGSQTVHYPLSLTAKGIQLVLESSTNLIDWSPVSDDLFEGLIHNRDTPTATAIWQTSGSSSFYRLSAQSDE
jgi:hypothetical protein